MSSPTSRTLDLYRSLGYTVDVVEKWNPHTKTRKDLYGFADILAFNPDVTLAIQATSTSNMRSRVHKILACPEARQWLTGSGRGIVVIGWKKYQKPVDRKLWRPTVTEITLADFG